MIVTASNSMADGMDLSHVTKVVQAKVEDSGYYLFGPGLSPRWTFVPTKNYFQMRFDDMPIMDYALADQGNIREIRTYGLNIFKLVDQAQAVHKNVRWPMTIEMFSRAKDARDAQYPTNSPVKTALKSKKDDDILEGGRADGMTVEDIAKKHKLNLSVVKEQLKMGIDVEKEHSPDMKIRTQISLDHLDEDPKTYYTLLKYMETVAEEAKDDGLQDDLCPVAYHMAKAYVKMTKDDWNYLTPEDLKKDLDKGKKYFLLDVRKSEDFKSGYIKGATNIFWLDLFKAENLKKLPKDQKIVVYCYVGHTSSQAMVFLKLLGFDVIGLKFGMGESPVEGVPVAGWKDFGFETKRENDK